MQRIKTGNTLQALALMLESNFASWLLSTFYSCAQTARRDPSIVLIDRILPVNAHWLYLRAKLIQPGRFE